MKSDWEGMGMTGALGFLGRGGRGAAVKRRWGIRAFALASPIYLLVATNVHAVENGIYGAPTGGTDIRQAYLPDAPGFYGGVVGADFTSPDFRNQNGGLSAKNPAHLNAGVAGAGIMVVYPWKPFDFTIASTFQASLQYEDEQLNLPPVAGGLKRGYATGLGDSFSDVIYASKYLGLFGATPGSNNQLKYGLTVAGGLAVEVPVGSYNVRNGTPDFVNIGHNTFIWIPNIAATYLTGPNLSLGGDGTEISARLFYDMNEKNSVTNYQSGDVIDLDFAVTERYGAFQVGLAGDYVSQLTDDTQNGKLVYEYQPLNQGPGNRFGKIDLGPVLAYDFLDHSTLKFKALFPVEHTANFNNQAFVLSYSRKLVGF
jgi:hypothetical protein